MNKYQEAFKRLKNDIERSNCEFNVDDYLNTLKELVDKETPMKVNKKYFEIIECDDDFEYFPCVIKHYRCPNQKCKLHNRYEISFETTRCPICNQLLDWSEDYER